MNTADLFMSAVCALVLAALVLRAAHERRRRRGVNRPVQMVRLRLVKGEGLREGANRKRVGD